MLSSLRDFLRRLTTALLRQSFRFADARFSGRRCFAVAVVFQNQRNMVLYHRRRIYGGYLLRLFPDSKTEKISLLIRTLQIIKAPIFFKRWEPIFIPLKRWRINFYFAFLFFFITTVVPTPPSTNITASRGALDGLLPVLGERFSGSVVLVATKTVCSAVISFTSAESL